MTSAGPRILLLASLCSALRAAVIVAPLRPATVARSGQLSAVYPQQQRTAQRRLSSAAADAQQLSHRARRSDRRPATARDGQRRLPSAAADCSPRVAAGIASPRPATGAGACRSARPTSAAADAQQLSHRARRSDRRSSPRYGPRRLRAADSSAPSTLSSSGQLSAVYPQQQRTAQRRLPSAAADCSPRLAAGIAAAATRAACRSVQVKHAAAAAGEPRSQFHGQASR
jgi:hypothetical protein